MKPIIDLAKLKHYLLRDRSGELIAKFSSDRPVPADKFMSLNSWKLKYVIHQLAFPKYAQVYFDGKQVKAHVVSADEFTTPARHLTTSS